jgi:hypothetical protein
MPNQINEIKYVFKRKRKSWVTIKTFLYLTNSFY